MIKHRITIKVFDEEQYNTDWPPLNALEFVAWFQNQVNQIPEEYKDTAKIWIDSAHGYEDTVHATLSITYERMETDEEAQKRIQEEKDRFERLRIYHKKQLAELESRSNK